MGAEATAIVSAFGTGGRGSAACGRSSLDGRLEEFAPFSRKCRLDLGSSERRRPGIAAFHNIGRSRASLDDLDGEHTLGFTLVYL